jgi:parvulin-like peptidyl-prolyl isomerase
MRRYKAYFLLLLAGASFGAVAQVPGALQDSALRKAAPQILRSIKTTAAAEKAAEAYPQLGLRIVHLSDDRDTAASFAAFFTKKRGEQFAQGGYYYKVLERDAFDGMRCSYVFLDGGELGYAQIENIRRQVMAAYKAGTPFADLAKQYGMDGNKTGDTDWFREGQMVKDFEDAVRDHKAGDLFLVDVPDKRWYYVVLKTHADRPLRKVTLLLAKAGG